MTVSLRWVYEGGLPEDGRGRRNNPDLAAWLLLRGKADVAFDGGTRARARAGDWLFLPAGWRAQRFSDDARIFSICWRARWPDGRPLFDAGLPVVLPAAEHPRLEAAARRVDAFARRELRKGTSRAPRSRGGSHITASVFLRSEILLMVWLDRVVDAFAGYGIHPAVHELPDDRVLSALEVIETFSLSRKLSAARLAAAAGLSESQLNRLFVRHLGHTAKAHLEMRRIVEARHLLAKGDVPIKEVAFLLGFSSQSAFYNWFKKHEGVKPSDVVRRGR